jgi:hypothetical protein
MLPTLGLCLTILWQGALPGSTAPGEESRSNRDRVAIRGRVVDDETGEPIESYTNAGRSPSKPAEAPSSISPVNAEPRSRARRPGPKRGRRA